MKDFKEKYLKFIIRSKENRKFEETESFIETENPIKWDDWKVIKDRKVKLYTENPPKTNGQYTSSQTKSGNRFSIDGHQKRKNRQRILGYSQRV